jgi:uncharacterized RDD family membrane protein YckC
VPDASPAAPEGDDYRAGLRFGLPADGPGSVATWGQRVLALVIDWIACILVLSAVIGRSALNGGGAAATFAPLGIFFVEATVFTVLLGGSFGQIVLRIAVVRTDRSRPGPGRVAFRSMLICLAVPPLIFDRDRRGLHDLASGTVVVRR